MSSIPIEKLYNLLDKALQSINSIELFFTEGTQKLIRYRNNFLEKTYSSYFQGFSVRIIKNGKMGFAYGNNLSSHVIDLAIKNSFRGDQCDFSFPEPREPLKVKVNSPNSRDLFDIASSLNDARSEFSVFRSIPHYALELRSSFHHTMILNSSGINYLYPKSTYRMGILMYDENGQGADWVVESCREEDIESIEFLNEYLSAFHSPQISSSLSPGIYSILLSPNVVSKIISRNMNFLKKAFLTKKVGLDQKLYDPSICVSNDGQINWAVGSSPIDDEGIPTKRILIVKHGHFAGMISNLQTAAITGGISTGNGYRSYNSLPILGFANLVVSGGENTSLNLLSFIKDGIWVQNANVSPNFKEHTTEFEIVAPYAIRIKNGKVVGKTGSSKVRGDLSGESCLMLSSNLERWGRCIAPSVYLEHANVT
jgi:PmbA protein